MAILWVVTNGYLDDVPTPRIRDFEQRFYRFLEAEHAELLSGLGQRNELTDEVVAGLREATESFKQTFLG